MYPVQGGTQKIEMGRNKDSEYRSKLAAAKAQSDPNNSFMWGIQELGAGEIAADSRSALYGNPNIMAGELLAGKEGSFNPQADNAGNMPLENPMNQTGFLQGQVSATTEPQVDPQQFGAKAAERLGLMAKGQQWGGLNDRQQVFGA